MEQKARKFTIGELEFRSLSATDILCLSLFSLILLANILLFGELPKYRITSMVFLSFLPGILTISTPFGLRFRNVWFSLIWLLLVLVFAFANNSSLVYFPLASFLLYHIIRMAFWKNYNREFIPFEIARGHYFRYRSQTEGKAGSQKDKNYMKILFWIGFIIFLCCLFGAVGAKI